MKYAYFSAFALLLAGAAVSHAQESVPVYAPTFNSFEPAPAGPNGSPAAEPRDAFWLRVEYMLWWTKEGQTPPLVTNGSSELIGGAVDHGAQSGAGIETGVWFDPQHVFGIEGRMFTLENERRRDEASSTDFATLSRPFFDVTTNREAVHPVAIPGQQTGGITVQSSLRFWGAEANLCTEPMSGEPLTFGLLAGYRYLELLESLDVTETSATTAGATVASSDHFGTANYFHGGQIGAKARLTWNCLFVDARAKVAFGVLHETVAIDGTTLTRSPTRTATVASGVLALPSNSGSYGRDVFAVAPEVGILIGWNITRHIRASAGYNFLYLSNVLRPGDQIDRGLNPGQIPTLTSPGSTAGPARPAFSASSSDFWAQGLTFGFEIHF